MTKIITMMALLATMTIGAISAQAAETCCKPGGPCCPPSGPCCPK